MGSATVRLPKVGDQPKGLTQLANVTVLSEVGGNGEWRRGDFVPDQCEALRNR